MKNKFGSDMRLDFRLCGSALRHFHRGSLYREFKFITSSD